jgi:hypothetical protein
MEQSGDTTASPLSGVLELVLTALHHVRAGRSPAGAERDDDTDDVAVLLEALTLLRGLREQIAEWEPELITAAREAGASWVRLAPALGVTSRQAAERRYLRLRPTGTGETTGEARVEATREQRAGDRAVAQWANVNAAALRQLAGQVSALADLTPDAQHRVDQVHAALASDDAATLLSPLRKARALLTADHPDLAAQITAITSGADRQRKTALDQRHSP